MKNYFKLLLDFIKDNEDWKDLLSKEPYCLNIKQCPFTDNEGNLLYPELYMLSYNQLFSDFSKDIIRATRGSIVSIENAHEPKMICTPFYKFFNYGQQEADDIDWSSAVVRDKIDGCLIKYFNYKNNWIWITNNGWNVTIETPSTLISQYKEPETEGMTSFKELIDYSLMKAIDSLDLGENLNKDYTYMFELISPQNRIICDYPKTELYLLGARNVNTYEEMLPEDCKAAFSILENFKHPAIFNLKNIDDVIKLCNSYSDNTHEGVVVCDKNFDRFKIKCNYYLQLKGFKGELGFTDKKIYEAIISEAVDDIIAVFPEIQDKVKKVQKQIIDFREKILKMCTEAVLYYNDITDENIQKTYADWVCKKNSKYKRFLFECVKKENRMESFIKHIRYDDLVEILEEN